MGSRYYSGVPSMSEQFTPVIASTVKKYAKRSFFKQVTHSPMVVIMTFLMSWPLLPFWAGAMIIGESLKLVFATGRNTQKRAQRLYNVKLAWVLFGMGVVTYMIMYRLFGTFRFVFDQFWNLITF